MSNKSIVVNLDKLEEVLAYLALIECVPLEEIEWQRNGHIIKPSETQIKEWRFTGLNNRDFAKTILLES